MSDEPQPGLTRLDEERAQSMADEGGAAAAAAEPNEDLDAFLPAPDETEDEDRD